MDFNKIKVNEFFKKNWKVLPTEHLLEIYENNKLIYRCEYEIIGIYDKINKIWTWSPYITFINQSKTKLIRKLKEFNYKKEEIKKLALTNNIKAEEKNIILFILMGCYISNSNQFTFNEFDNFIEYFCITKIIEDYYI